MKKKTAGNMAAQGKSGGHNVRASSIHGVIQYTPQEQKTIYTDWANHFLEKAGSKQVIADLQVDVTNGVLLAKVIEAVIDDKVPGINGSPRTNTQMLENLDKCLQFLAKKKINVTGITARQLREGNLKAVLGLFFALSRHKQQLQQEDQARKKAAKAHQSGPPSQLSKATHSAIPQQKTVPSAERAPSSGRQITRRQSAIPSSSSSSKATSSSRPSIPRPQSSTRSSSQLSIASQESSGIRTPSSRSSGQSRSRPPSQASLSAADIGPSRPPSSRSSSQGRSSRPSSQISVPGDIGGSRTPKTRSPTRSSRPTSVVSESGGIRSGGKSAASRGHSQIGGGLPRRKSSLAQSSGSISTRSSASSDMSKIPMRGGPSGPNTNQNRLSTASEKSRVPSGSSGTKSAKTTVSKPQTGGGASGQRLVKPTSKLKAPSTAKQVAKPEPPQRTTSMKQSQAENEKVQQTKDKGSMLTKLKLFSDKKEGEVPKTGLKAPSTEPKASTGIPSTTASQVVTPTVTPVVAASSAQGSRLAQPKSGTKPATGKGLKLQGPRKSGDFSKQVPKPNAATKKGGTTTSTPKKSEEPEPTASPSRSALKAVAQKTIGKAFGGSATGKGKESPKLGRKGETQQQESPTSDVAIYSDTGYESMDRSRDGSLPKKEKGQESSDDGYLSANSMKRKSKMGLSKIAPPMVTSPSASRSKLKPPQKSTEMKSGLAAPKVITSMAKVSKDGTPETSPFQRGGVYSTFPAVSPVKSKPSAITSSEAPPKESDPIVVQDKVIEKGIKSPLPASPSHKSSLPGSPSRIRTPANTATVAPFNYSGNKTPVIDGESSSPQPVSMSTQMSVSSTTSQSSDNSVIYKQKSLEEEVCTTEYENDKAVTTFGTPKQQRSFKKTASVSSPSSITVMTVQKDRSAGPVKETTFGDSVTTQVKHPVKQNITTELTTNEINQLASKKNSSAVQKHGSLPNGSVQSYQGVSSHQTGQRLVPSASSVSKYYSGPSMRRTFSNRSHLSDLQYSDHQSQEGSECASEDTNAGYLSDGDILHRHNNFRDLSGYMSEGGSTLYARRMGTLFRSGDGMAALREYLQKPIEMSDDDESIDSSSISSGGLSDTINEISTDDNVTGSSSRNSFESAKNLEIFSDNIQFEDYEELDVGKGDGYMSDSKVKVPRYLKTSASSPYIQSRRMSSNDSEIRLLTDTGDMSRVEIRKTGEVGSSGRTVPPPNWQRSLDRLAARQRQKANLGLTRTDAKSLDSKSIDSDSGSKGGHSPLQGRATTPTGRSQAGFGYRKPGGYAGKSGLSPAGLAAQKSIKDTIDKLSTKSAKSDSTKKTSPTGLGKKTSPGNGSQSRLRASLGKGSPGSVWLKQNGSSEGKSRIGNGGLKSTSGSKKTSPSGTKTAPTQNPSGIVEKSDQSRDPNSLKSLFVKKGDQTRLLKKDTIISNPHAMDKGHSVNQGLSGIHSISMSDTDSSTPMRQRTSTLEGFGRLPLDESRFSGYVSDSYASGRNVVYSPMGFPSRHDRHERHERFNSGVGSHSLLRKGPESASMESLESNNSSAYSVASHAASEMVGPTYGSGLSANISRSTSLRSSLSDRTYKPPLSLLEKSAGQVDWLNGSYSHRGDRSSVQLSPTESTTSHPPMNFFPMASMSNQGAPTPNLNRHLRNGSLSIDDRQRATLSICALLNEGNEELHGSTMSLQSAPSFYSSMTPSAFPRSEEQSAAEIERLKRDLEREQDRVSSLSRDLSANAHVVAAFEQSLTGMTSRLQQLTSSTEQKDSELQDLREKIEQLKIAHAEGRNGALRTNGTDLIRKHSIGSKDQILGETRLSRQTSCESMSSLASMTSMSSAGSAMTDTEGLDSKKNKKKKNWVSSGEKIRSSFRSAFGRKKKASGTTTDVEDLDNSMTFVNDSLIDPPPPQGQMKQSASTSAIYDSEQSEETITDLKRQLRDKEGKLTDIKLEALTSQHQLDQMQEQMNKMKSEMMVLKQENERLQRQVHTRKSVENSSLNSLNSTGSSKRLSRDSLDRHRLSLNSDHGSGSLDILIDDNSGMTSNSQRIVVTVLLGNPLEGDKEGTNGKQTEVMIGTIGISSKTNWDALDSVVRRIFKEYVLRIDPMTNLGLSAESVHHYIVGEISRTKDADPPELLPCGYLVGDKTSITIALKDYKNNSCDSLVFETLVPKPILQRYISLLLEHKRIILCGPSGTGKTYLAQKLAEHILQRSGKEPNEGNIATFNVDHKSGKELRQYLTHIADQCETNALDLPTVIILDNLHHAGSLGEIFTGFLSYKYHKCPYIIGTMNQATCQSTNLQLHHNFRWVLCANHMEPVKGFLGRYLRRKLIEAEVKHNTRNNDLNKVIEWMPKVWQHLNKFLETHNSSDVTIGPRLFLQCPIDLPGSQVWFTDLWNYSIVPYLLEAVREGLQLYGRKASWEDPSDWVFESYPWTSGSQESWPSLLKLRPEDIGFDGYKVQGTNSKGQTTKPQGETEGDPLLSMLMHLQEASGYSSPHSCDSPTI
ncbi:Neuron navigator 2 [Holothuria leucospilota]|uniref:Neuron navigator 2 n=1 Tax=Holothuria leucospilota TaxID=206669 RepID=A0A9Q1BT20_HOLLE|nr:Neuron navigator 2 [Holothuria leucospilota]